MAPLGLRPCLTASISFLVSSISPSKNSYWSEAPKREKKVASKPCVPEYDEVQLLLIKQTLKTSVFQSNIKV